MVCLLKIKIKQNSGCPNKEHNAIFKRIHQNIRAYQKSVRKTVDWSIIGKIIIWKILLMI